MKIEIGDKVKINFETSAESGGYKSVSEMLPYFQTEIADNKTLEGGVFEVTDVIHSGVFNSGEEWRTLALKPVLKGPFKGLSVEDFMESELIEDAFLSFSFLRESGGFILIEDYNLEKVEQIEFEEPSVETNTVTLPVINDKGSMVGTINKELTSEQISDIISHAVQLACIYKEKGTLDEDVMDELTDALEIYSVI